MRSDDQLPRRSGRTWSTSLYLTDRCVSSLTPVERGHSVTTTPRSHSPPAASTDAPLARQRVGAHIQHVPDDQRDTIERLERRVEVLEHLVRRLAAVHGVSELAQPRAQAERPAPAMPAAPAPAVRVAPLPPLPGRTSPSIATDLEQWFGQRGLLIVGSAALLVAGVLFLKYAFDRGWIPPLVRSLTATASGIAVAAWGDQRLRHGMRPYGATLVGAGGGLVFLGLWAAAGPYALIDRRTGVLLLAASTVLVTLLALNYEIEGLALWALSGAYLAPLLLPPPVPNYDAFLGYLELIGIGTGLLAYTMSWRRTFDLALFGYLLLAATGASPALEHPLGSWLIASGAVLTLHVTRQRGWPEARLGILCTAWIVLGISLAAVTGTVLARWLAFGAAVAVWALLWWQHMERDPFDTETVDTANLVERILYVLNPIALLLLGATTTLYLLENHLAVVAAPLGLVYLAAGWLQRTASGVLMGFMLAAVAMALEWHATDVVLGWTVLAGAALALERQGGRPGGRVASVLLATGAFVCLFTAALADRDLAGPVFSDSWALAFYVYVAGTVLCARWWGVESKPTPWERSGSDLLWALCGVAVFGGGTIELSRWFGRLTSLAGDLALSVWWLVYAGMLVWLGFRLDRKVIRSAGLCVAAAAGLKIVLYDLSNLEALYRVGSFFALAVIALAVAYAYNRKVTTESA
jgi:hypothetical protein